MTKYKHGGKREGAGRKPIGITKKVSITLDSETWDRLDQRKKNKNITQSAVLRSIIETHYKPVEQPVNARATMWWELVRKNILEGYVEIKKSNLRDCIEHRGYSKTLEAEVWKRCVENSKGYKKTRISYLLEAVLFEGNRLLLDKDFESIEEQVIFSVIEYVKCNRKIK